MEGAWPTPVGTTGETSADPREGSAAWKAEQIANGNMPIPGMRPAGTGFGPPPAVAQSTSPPSFLPLIAFIIKIAIPVGIAFFVWLQFFHSTAPSAEEVQAAFVPIAGYEYGGSDSPAAETVKGMVSEVPGFDDEVAEFEVKELYSNGTVVGLVMIGGFEYNDDVQAEFSAGAGNQGLTPVTLGTAGRTFPAFQISQPPAHGIMWLDEDGYFFTVVTTYPNHAQTVATALGTAALQ